MDWIGIGQWAGDNGPWVAIIGLQWAIIWRLLNRFFAQQDMVMKAMDVAERSTRIAQDQVTDEPL